MPTAPELHEHAFRAATDALLPYRVRVAALTCLAANGAFAAVDALSLPAEDIPFRTAVRLGFTPLYFAGMLLAARRPGQRFPQALVLMLGAVQALELGLLGTQLPVSDGAGVGVFPALSWTAALLFFAAFLPLPLWRTGILSSFFVIAFAALHLWLGQSSVGAVLKHAGNIAVAGAAAMVAALMVEKLRRSEFFTGRRLAAANLRMEELVRAKDQFFTDVSHELRTPLTAALLAIQADGEPRPRPHAALRPLRRLQKLVDEMLELSRVDAGFARASGEVIDLVAAVRRIVEEFASSFAAKGLELRLDVLEEIAFVRVGADAFEKIAVNLLGNALKYTSPGGTVLVHALNRAGTVALEVQDDGPGIAAADIPRIFDRFIRVGRPGAAPGSGIGLALAKELTELHGGRLVCESEEGRGSTFRASWPAAEPAAGPPAEPPPGLVLGAIASALDGDLASTSAPREGPTDGPLVLVIEDHRDLAARIAASLGPSVRTRLVHDGTEGLLLACSIVPDLIICDELLPGLGGHELVRRLREDPAMRLTPVLMLSALAEREYVLTALAAGADDAMAKPFDAAMLRARVDALLRLRRRRENPDQSAHLLKPLFRGFALALGYDSVLLLVGEADGRFRNAAWGGALAPPEDGWERADAPWAATSAARALVSARVPCGPVPAAVVGLGTAVAAPIVRGGRSALLVGIARAARTVTPLEVDSLAAASLGVAGLLDRERTVSALAQSADEQHRLSIATLSAQDSERRRLAVELHDGTGQVLTAALIHLDLARRARASDDGFATAASLVRQALAELRALARDLHPPMLSQQGLHEALRSLAASLSSPAMTVEAEIAADTPTELGARTSLALFRIAQAALANVAAHSGARRAVVRLRAEAGAVLLEVEDDGLGFVPNPSLYGVGLHGMRERATSLAGSMSIESQLGRGTLVRATAPLEPVDPVPLVRAPLP